MGFLPLIFANLKRRKLRTFLTIGSIAVAFLLFGFLSAVKTALSQGIDVAGADRLIVRHKVSIIQPLPESYQRDIARIDGVAEVTHATWFGGIYQDPKNFFPQIPVKPEEYLSVYPEFILSPEEKEAWLNTKTGAVVGRTLAERFGFKVGDRIPIMATIWPKSDGSQLWEFDIVGIYDGAEKGTDTSQLFFRHDYFDETRGQEKGMVGWYIVRVSDADRAVEVSEAIDRTFANSFAETKAETEGAFVQGFATQIGNTAAITASIISAVFFTILLLAGNTVAQSVRERIRELAVLKALGFTDGTVLWMVLAEAGLIAGIGGFLGLAAAWLIIAQGDPTNGVFPVFYFPIDDLLWGVFWVLLLGFVSGVFPALQARRLQISEALRR